MSMSLRPARCAVAAMMVVAVVELPASGGPGTGSTFCPPEAHQDSERCGSDVNGGCSSVPPVFIDLSCGDVWCGNAWADGGTRDVDWYLVDLIDPDGDGVEKLTATVVSDIPVVCFLIDGIGPNECNPVAVGIGCGDGGLNIAVASATLQAPSTYAVVVAAGDCSGDGIFDGFPCGTQNSYFLSVQCASPHPADADGAVGIADLVALLESWCADPGRPPNAVGDVINLLELLANWGN